MGLETIISHGSLLIAIYFSLMMIRRETRKFLLLPVVLLYGLSIYEFAIDAWEKTVSAPIRIDLLLETPLMAGLALWCIIAAMIASEKARHSRQRQ